MAKNASGGPKGAASNAALTQRLVDAQVRAERARAIADAASAKAEMVSANIRAAGKTIQYPYNPKTGISNGPKVVDRPKGK